MDDEFREKVEEDRYRRQLIRTHGFSESDYRKISKVSLKTEYNFPSKKKIELIEEDDLIEDGEEPDEPEADPDVSY